MKFPLTIIFLLITPSPFAQNLVPNPSFEDTIHCPTNTGEIANAKFWFSPLTPLSSSDYFNSCSPYLNVPNSPLGFQQARTGNAFAGIILYWHVYPNYREYIEIKLTASLIQNKKYCIEFFANLANASKFALDKIGLFLSNDSIIKDSLTTIYNTPQIINNINIIYDTLSWVKISGEYYALGGEQFITIGNFYNFSSINIDTVGYPIDADSYAYYYIDDVSVYMCEDTMPTENQLTISNAFTPNGDGVNDYFKAHGQNIKSLNAKIFNRWGMELYEWNNINSCWDGKYNGNDVSEGVYFYFIEVNYIDGKSETRQGSIEVVK